MGMGDVCTYSVIARAVNKLAASQSAQPTPAALDQRWDRGERVGRFRAWIVRAGVRA